MSKILVNDLKELAKQLPQTIVVPFNEFSIEVKTYISITDKINLVSSIYQSAINEDDSLSVINYNALNIAYKVLVAKAYSDVSLPKDTVQAYNTLVQTGLYDKIYQSIPLEERLELETVFDNYIDEKNERYEREITRQNIENSIENTIKNGKDELILAINKLIDKLPEKDQWGEIAKDVSGAVNNLDPSKLKFISQVIGWNKGVK